MTPYEEFIERFKLLISKDKDIIVNTLSNIFSMRIIGNKTHGDLAEIAISEFINQFMYDYKSIHVGKDLYRAKKHEEDISVESLVGTHKGLSIPISLKAYGDGYLQLSTDKESILFNYLKKFGNAITDPTVVKSIVNSQEFQAACQINVMPLIYDEGKKQCNIMVFDIKKAYKNVEKIVFIDKKQAYDYSTQRVIAKKGRTYPIYLFIDGQNKYVCEIRYGGVNANALQRGFWTHTKKASGYFDSLTEGWVSYAQNQILVKLFSLALNASPAGHQKANEILLQDIENIKKTHGI